MHFKTWLNEQSMFSDSQGSRNICSADDRLPASDPPNDANQSLSNLNADHVCFGRDQTILLERERIKRNTIKTRRLLPTESRIN